MDSLVYAPESANQQEPWQIGLPAHFPTELPNIAPLTAEASLPPQSLLLMHDISNLIAAITMATSQGPNSPAYILGQTFHPLIQMAVDLQINALQGGVGPTADQMMLPGIGNGYYQPNEHGPVAGGVRTEKVPPEGKKRKGDGGGGSGRQQHNASNARESRRRKTSSRFSDFVHFDDV